MRSINIKVKRSSMIRSQSAPLKFTTLIAFVAVAAMLLGCAEELSQSSDFIHISELKVELRSAHFDFYADKCDAYVLPRMEELMEGSYDRVISDLSCTEMPRVSVFVYPDLVSFHDGVGWINDANWFASYCECPDSIHMVSPLEPGPAHTYQSIMGGVVHDFTHAVTCQIRGGNLDNCPVWLYEGVACYQAGQVPDSALIEAALVNDAVPNLYSLQIDFRGNNGYDFSYTIIEYAVEAHGWEALNRLIISPSDYEGAFGEWFTQWSFEYFWQAYLREHYLTI